MVGHQGQQGLLSYPYTKYNYVKNVFIDYFLYHFHLCKMSTKLLMISIVEAQLEYPT